MHRSIQQVIILSSFLVSSTSCYSQTSGENKIEGPQPTNAINSPAKFVVNPVVPHTESAKPVQRNKSDSIDWGPYMNDLQRKIRKAWLPPMNRESPPKAPGVIFKIDKEGHVFELRLKNPSKDELIDNAAMNAVEKAAPFSPLPKGAKDPTEIQFEFGACPVFKGPPKASSVNETPHDRLKTPNVNLNLVH